MKCERCNAERSTGRRFCQLCERSARQEMKRAGYFAVWPTSRAYRPKEAREKVWETKYGLD